MLMSFMRKLGLILSSSVLKLLLLTLAFSFALVGVLGTPDEVKQAADQSGLYDNAVDSFIDSAQQENQTEGSEELGVTTDSLSLKDPEIRKIANSAFPPEQIKTWSEDFIDSFYVWLNGESEAPAFRIDLRDSKQAFISGIIDYGEERFRSLPACSPQESLRLSRQGEIDIFSVSCRPAVGGTLDKQKLAQELDQSMDFFGDGIITAEDLSEDGQDTFSSDDNRLPDIFQLIKSSPAILAALSLPFMAGVVYLAKTKRDGTEKIGWILIGSGIVVAIAAFILSKVFEGIKSADGPLGGTIGATEGGLQGFMIDILSLLSGSIGSMLYTFAAAYALLGIVVLLAIRFMWPSTLKQPSEEQIRTN